MRSCWKREDTSPRGQRRSPGASPPPCAVLVRVGWLASEPQRCRPQLPAVKGPSGGAARQDDPPWLSQGAGGCCVWEQRRGSDGVEGYEQVWRDAYIDICLDLHMLLQLPCWHSGKESACQCRRRGRRGFDPWVGKIPLENGTATHSSILAWRIPGQRSLVGYSPRGLRGGHG